MDRTRLAVDALDMRILREIVSGGSDYFRSDRAALDDVARKVGVHRNTVSERVSRMETHGFLLPLTVEVDPTSAGLVAVIAALDIPFDRRTEATRHALLELDGVWGILTYLDAWILLVHGADDRAIDGVIEQASVVAGAKLLEIEGHSGRDFPEGDAFEWTPLDVRIVSALMADARKPFRAIAADLGVTAKTVERRYGRLAREGVVTLFPTGGVGATGLTLADLRIALPEDASIRRRGIGAVDKLVPDHWFRAIRPRGLVHYGVYAASASDLDDLAATLRTVPEVSRVGLRIWTGQFQSPRYAAWLLKRLEAFARDPPREAPSKPTRAPSKP